MIVNNYNITFSDGKAPVLNCKYSEVNREYILKPDVELNGDTYSAELVIVKPDMTFTINTATIDNDRNIIVTIPSQATVVKGVAQYLVRIYNNNTDVYSAYGELWVDDNLLTDDVIESVAEVNGYTFPDDFALKSEIPEIDDTETTTTKTWSSEKISNEIASATPSADTFIDDDDVLYDKTWSSEKISYELGNITAVELYSKTEQVVGKWFNGKNVYQIVIERENVSTGFSYYDVSDLHIEQIVKLSGVYNMKYSNTVSVWYDFNYYSANNFKGYLEYDDMNNRLRIEVQGSGYTIPKQYIILRYTKTN